MLHVTHIIMTTCSFTWCSAQAHAPLSSLLRCSVREAVCDDIHIDIDVVLQVGGAPTNDSAPCMRTPAVTYARKSARARAVCHLMAYSFSGLICAGTV